MVRVGGREYTGLLESPCYKHGNEERGVLSCLSCHTMHKPIEDPRSLREWANDQLKEDMETNTACVGCHEGFDSNEELVAHTHHRADSSGSNCNNCHTPHTTYGLLKAIRSHTVDSPSVAVSVKTGRPNACNLCHLDKTLAWTSAHLLEWYGVPSPTLSEDERSIAASVLWILRGDAVQRALLAWSLGWEPARQISGTEWMGLYLSQLIMDPYGAVRFIANRSLGANPGYDAIQFDFVSPEEERTAAGGRVWDLWNRTESQAAAAKGAAVLVTENGNVNKDVFRRLLRERDNRGIVIAE
jgi:nitrate/TMAO reductase-like tetraheme cytochrome c subunit